MKVKFNHKEYKSSGRNGTALKNLCFDIFKQYLSEHINMTYSEIQNIFNKWHCNNHYVVLNQEDWEQKTENLQSRYFEPIDHNEEKLYFTTQWGNNGGDCDNINHMIKFAQEQNYNIEVLENSYMEINGKEKSPLSKVKNIILYGSPGVGKTHNTNKLISLIEEDKSDREIFEAIKLNEKSDSVDILDIKERVKFVTFHQGFGYEDFIEGFRPNENGKIELVDGVFKSIARQAQDNLDNASKDKKFDFENFLNAFVNSVESSEKFELEDGLTITVSKKSNGDFQSFRLGGRVKHQSLTKDIIKRDFDAYLQGNITHYQEIKPTYESQSPSHGNAPYYFKLYGVMKKFLDTNKEKFQAQNTELKNYYLVIDEINRGNISKIFGELITLIEEDKRDNLEVTLPYSKQPFKIPSNLYIIGTMNSTDKSIALIDIALRRRFTFLKMKPNEKLIEFNNAKDIFNLLNNQITKDLGEDYQIGHSYFMKIADDSDLDFVLKYKVIPLLEEYYYGDDRLENIVKLCNLGKIDI